mmetsp:Transcript_30340/g.92684  ORF Transcript_30340/g.92684 Transcript_30340/m.92684 type:complete len:87 (-) Transcript_30340:121-381(-)
MPASSAKQHPVNDSSPAFVDVVKRVVHQYKQGQELAWIVFSRHDEFGSRTWIGMGIFILEWRTSRATFRIWCNAIAPSGWCVLSWQ